MTMLQRMTWLFVAIGVVFTAAIAYTFFSLRSTRQNSEEVLNVGLERWRLASLARSEFLASQLVENDFIERGDTKAIEQYHSIAAQLRKSLEDYETLVPVAERGTVDELRERTSLGFQRFDERASQPAPASAQVGPAGGGAARPSGRSLLVERETDHRLEALVHSEEQNLTSQIRGISSGFQGTTLALGLLVAVVAFGMSVTYLGGRSTFLAISGVTRVIREVTVTGALDRQVPVGRSDEAGQLAASFNQMVETLRAMVKQMQEATNNLSSAGSQILAATSEQSASATEQAASVSEATTTIEEIRQTAEQAAERAQEMIGMADRSEQVSQTGAQAVARAVQGIDEVGRRVDAIAANILALSERTQQIGDIIATVTELAERSNLLAVNASIEAAKAGDHGRGFAVVAREVHSLADQSKTATKQIRAILGEIQKATNDAVMVTEEGTKRAEAAVKQAEQAGSNIQELAQAIQATAQASRQIASSSRQQSVGIDQIVLAFKHINQATAESVTGARQTETSAASLRDLAERMRALVVRYRL